MDADLVHRAQQGDEVAFAGIVEAVGARFLGIAERILHDASLAEDATQQALVKCWRFLPTLREPARFEAWSHQLLVRACYTESDRRRRSSADVALLPTDAPTTPDSTSRIVDRDQLERGLQGISVDHRAVLVLHYYADMPLAQVAEVLDVPVGTIYSRLHRAHRSLRGALEADARTATIPLPTEATR